MLEEPFECNQPIGSSTQKSSSYSYQVGGSLPLSAPSYVLRAADLELYEGLKSAEFCYVLNSRQMGKSSLRVQTMRRLQTNGIACGVIDITSIGTQQVTPEQWYASLLGSLVSSFRLKVNLRAWWRERSDFSCVKRLSEFVETVLLTEVSQTIVIFIDEIDSILSLKFPIDDFFAWIRACYNKRAEYPAYERLTFALLGVATPADLISDKNRTPFNIGRAIELNGFQLQESQPLAQGLVGKVSNPQAVLAEVLAWTGGQPFLTQKLSQLVVQEEAESIEQLVQRRVIENWESQDDPEHLKTIRDRLLRNEQRASRLLGLYQKIWQQGSLAADDSAEQMELLLSGLVVKQGETLTVRNRIYQEVFHQRWVDKQLAKLRPYSEALRAWVSSAYKDESRLLRGKALKDAKDWSTGKSLSDLDYQFLAASQELDRRDIQRTLESEREAAGILSDAVETLSEAQEKAKKTIRQGFFVLATLSVAAVGLFGLAGILAWQAAQAQHRATVGEIRALSLSSEALFASNRRLDALIEAIKAKQKLRKFDGVDADTKTRVELILRQAVFGVKEYNHLSGHKEGVWGVAFSPNGQMIASTSEDKTIKLWKLDGIELTTLKGHSAAVYGVAFSPNGQMIASASGDNTVKLWKLDGTELTTLKGHSAAVWGVAFSPDGQLIASASGDNTVKLWKLDGTELTTLKGHSAAVYGVAFSPDGQLIASTSEDNTVKLWKRDGTYLTTLKGHSAAVYGVAFSPNGQMIASTSEDKTIKLWKLDGTELTTLKGHSAAVWGVAFSPDGQKIASGSWDKTVKLWNKSDGTEQTTFQGHTDRVRGIAFSPDGQKIASGSWDKTVKLWNKSESILFHTLRGHGAAVYGVSISPNSQMIASASQDKTVKLWKLDGTELTTIQNGSYEALRISISPNGQMIASTSHDKTIKLWKLDGTELTTFKGHTLTVWGVAFSPDGQLIASASGDNTVKLWKLDGTELTTLKGHSAVVYGVAFSPDGQLIASASGDNTVKLWKLDGTELTTLKGHSAAVYGVAFSPDGQLIASASGDNTVKLWKLDGTELTTLKGHSAAVYEVAFSPDGQLIASTSQDKTVKLWKRDGTYLTTLKGHSAAVWGVAFSPDGQLIASASEDNTVKLWNLARVLDTDGLLVYSCNWMRDYLRTNAEVEESDRHLCDDIKTR